MLSYDTAGQSADEMLRELREGKRVSEINAIYHRGAIELVAMGHGTARFIMRLRTSLLWVLEDETLLSVSLPVRVKVYKPEEGKND